MLGLARRGLGQLGAAVADLTGEEPGQAVEVALAVLVVDPDAFTPDDDRDVAGGRHPGEVHPEVAMGALLERFVGHGGHLVPQV